MWQQRGDGTLPTDLEPQVQLLPAESPWQHQRKHTQVTMHTTSAKVKQAESTKVVSYPALS